MQGAPTPEDRLLTRDDGLQIRLQIQGAGFGGKRATWGGMADRESPTVEGIGGVGRVRADGHAVTHIQEATGSNPVPPTVGSEAPQSLAALLVFAQVGGSLPALGPCRFRD